MEENNIENRSDSEENSDSEESKEKRYADIEQEDALRDELYAAINQRDFEKAVRISENNSGKFQYVSLRECLFTSCYYSNEDDAIFLIENGVEIFKECVREIGYNGNVKIAQAIIDRLLFNQSKSPNITYKGSDDENLTMYELLECMLRNTFINSMEEVAKLCIKYGATNLGNYLINAYEYSSMHNVYEMLLQYGAKSVEYDLYYACRNNNIDGIKRAIAMGATNFDKCFDCACNYWYFDTAKKLLLPHVTEKKFCIFIFIQKSDKKYFSLYLEISENNNDVYITNENLTGYEIQFLLNHAYCWKFKYNQKIIKKLTNQRHIRIWCVTHVIDELSKDRRIKDWDRNLIKIISEYVSY